MTFSIVSFGGGVNSTAVLAGLREHGERPDAIVFADTGGEKPETYAHVGHMAAWCQSVGFPPVEIVSERQTLEQDCLDRETLPGKAFGFGSCSEHFKIRPQRRWLKEKGWQSVEWLVGFHAGEGRRVWPGANPGETIRHPLIEWRWGQAECETV
jgi:3'-phosphoadenosine 5'-phosphosulfate sulfotransferase (PAPS reductase)/FAD synthetase